MKLQNIYLVLILLNRPTEFLVTSSVYFYNPQRAKCISLLLVKDHQTQVNSACFKLVNWNNL